MLTDFNCSQTNAPVIRSTNGKDGHGSHASLVLESGRCKISPDEHVNNVLNVADHRKPRTAMCC